MRKSGIQRVGAGLLALALLLTASVAQAAQTVTLYVTDAQGTVVVQMTPQGAGQPNQVTYTAAYRPYGTQVLGAPQDGPGYTGHVNDADSGLVYMQQRYYDPESQRFASVDPVGPSPGNVFNFNRYDYANDNPVRFTDPDGRDSFSVARPAYKFGKHTFVVVADKPGGKIRAEFHYGPSGSAIQTLTTGSKLVSLTGTGTPTAQDDAKAFQALSNPSAASAAGITATRINATDNSVIAAGNTVNQVVGTLAHPGNVTYKPLPIRFLGSSPGNSNSAAAAVVDMAQASSGNRATGHDNQAIGSGAAQNIEHRIPVKSCGTRVCSN